MEDIPWGIEGQPPVTWVCPGGTELGARRGTPVPSLDASMPGAREFSLN